MAQQTTLMVVTILVAVALVTMTAATTMMTLTPAAALNECQKNFGKDACRGCRNSQAANSSLSRCFQPPNN